MQNIKLISLPTRKDERGWVITPPPINLSAGQWHIPSLKPKAIRGNHYHETFSEAVIILGGKCRVATRNRLTDTHEEFIYDGVVKQLIVIPPGISHAFKNIDYHSIYLVCCCYNSKSDKDETDKTGNYVTSTTDRILT